MKNSVILLISLIALYLILGGILQLTYGPSYGFFSGEDSWQPDGSGGWVKHGHPSGPAPEGPSVNVPILLNYLPIFVPGLVLAAFLFTPLSKKLQPPKPPTEAASVGNGAETSDDQPEKT